MHGSFIPLGSVPVVQRAAHDDWLRNDYRLIGRHLVTTVHRAFFTVTSVLGSLDPPLRLSFYRPRMFFLIALLISHEGVLNEGWPFREW